MTKPPTLFSKSALSYLHSHPKWFFFLPFIFLSLGMLVSCAPPTTLQPVTPTISITPSITSVPTDLPTQTPWVITTTPQVFDATAVKPQGTFFLSLPDGGYYHLFAYSPETLPLTRLTSGGWDDITPALSPDGTRLVFASRQNGYWDIYSLNLLSGEFLRLSDSLTCDLAPSWSPDGAWLAYETCGPQSLDIAIRSSTDPVASPILLTSDIFMDTSPAWSPGGRQIAFISNRSGEPEVWIADLDRATSDQLVNISASPETVESHPSWSPDGTRLAWSSTDPSSGLTILRVWDARTPNSMALLGSAGDWPVWQDTNHIASRLSSPLDSHLVAYALPENLLSLPPVLLPGELQGLTYGITASPLNSLFQAAAQLTPAPLFIPMPMSNTNTIPGRTSLVDIPRIQAAFPQLSDAADDSFAALRSRVAIATGWDALASLDNAYVPLTTPLDPGLGQDWLYTGRAFSLNPALIQAGWMVIVREDFGQQTWWRIFLRTYAQDGSQGLPLRLVPWDFSTRTGSSMAYENGGSLMDKIPSGYWVDLTALAANYGWERLPAITNWRTYFSGARFNELAFINGSTWQGAMLELYPPEALFTPTIVIPPTRTPTRTPLWYRTPTPTRTATPNPTNTP